MVSFVCSIVNTFIQWKGEGGNHGCDDIAAVKGRVSSMDRAQMHIVFYVEQKRVKTLHQ